MIYPDSHKIRQIWDWLSKIYGDYLIKKSRVDRLNSIILDLEKKVIFNSVSLTNAGLRDKSYIVVHSHNPEDKEIGSISGIGNTDVKIYDGEDLIGYGAYNEETHNQLIEITAGTHTIKVVFNGITEIQVINIDVGETKVLTFEFSRTIFDLWSNIPATYEKIASVSGSWLGETEDIIDQQIDNLGWELYCHFQEPYDGGYDGEGHYIQSSGSYDTMSRSRWTKTLTSLNYELYVNYDITVNEVPGRPEGTPYWGSYIMANSGISIPLSLYNSNFSNWYIQYSNYCSDLSMQVGGVELLDSQGSYKIKTVVAINGYLKILDGQIQVSVNPGSKTKSGGGNIDLVMSSIPYDLVGDAV